MSSDKKPEVEVSQLHFRNVKKKAGKDDTTFRRTVRSDHGYPQITLPKFFLELCLRLNQEVIVMKRESSNPLNWEIVIKPRVQKMHLAEARK